ncbi:putative inner membrane protein [Escherichia coli]|nr:putative inner membrane protein [Escherichia coli]
MSKLIVPQWPQPKGVAACSSTRIGGVSLPPYDSLNLGAHCGDNPDHVEENRKRLFAAGNLPSKPVWLEQVHGKDVLKLTGEPYASKRADASYSNTPGTVCASDDCRLPPCAVLPIERERKSPPLMLAGVDCAQACWKRRFPVLLIIRKIFSPG